MLLFETINCNLCGSSEHQLIYRSKQFADSSLGNLDINIVMCKHCLFIFQNPQLTAQALCQHYKNRSSGNVFHLNSSGSIHNIFYEETIAMINDFVSDKDIKNICDIGGGGGQILSRIEVHSDVKRYLIEPSDALNKCNDSSIIKIKQRVEDLKEKDLPKIDLLICTATLEHLKNPTHILQKFFTLLKSDGYLFIEIPNSLHPYQTFAEFYSYEHVSHFTIKTILLFLDKTGFFPIRMDESTYHPSFKIIAQKFQKSTYQNHCIDIFSQHYSEKKQLAQQLKKKINRKIKIIENSVFAIYGTGDHTRFLLEEITLLPHVNYFIDSDPGKWGNRFHGIEIISPNDIENKKISNILISSHDFEPEIYQTIMNKCSHHINIIKLYG
ncbi:MAG TPA: methyltransferase domain-containing protein [Gammaproteobacteria bacterium]|nr:methyltransferase domain-containing protein [Gammaproteobacteria bacterium]